MISYIPPDGKRAAILAAKLLHSLDITSIPIPIYDIVERLNIGLISYQGIAKDIYCDVGEVAGFMQSEDGAAMATDDGYSIAYNDTIPHERKRFTIAHELGHILMDHFTKAGSTKLAKGKTSIKNYFIFEDEADMFAGNLLVPPTLLYESKIESQSRIHYFFEVSKSCAYKRTKQTPVDLHYLQSAGLYQRQAQQFKPSIDTLPMGKPTQNRCTNVKGRRTCGIYLRKNEHVCPLCGSPTTQWVRHRFSPRDYDGGIYEIERRKNTKSFYELPDQYDAEF